MYEADAYRAQCVSGGASALLLSFLLAVAGLLFTAGCGAMNDPANGNCVRPPSPHIDSYRPTSIQVHAGLPRVVLDGSGFTTSSVIVANNAQLPVIYTSSSEITGTLSSSQTAFTVPVTIVVFNAFPQACFVDQTNPCLDFSSRCGNVSNSVVVQITP